MTNTETYNYKVASVGPVGPVGSYIGMIGYTPDRLYRNLLDSTTLGRRWVHIVH